MTGEEIHTKIAVLTCLGRDGDTDDLTGTTLQEKNVSDADEMALNWNTAAGEAWFHKANTGIIGTTGGSAASLFSDDDLVIAATTTMVMMVVAEGMHNAIGGALYSAAEAVVLSVVVVVTHVSFGGLVECDALLCYSGFGVGTSTFVFDVVGGLRSTTVVSLGDVELRFKSAVVGLASGVIDVDVIVVVAAATDVDVDIGGLVLLAWCTVPDEENESATWFL